MRELPKVAIAGRPNVGKSSLMNALSGRRVAIVDSIPGTTRDRVTNIVTRDGRSLEFVDTGGIAEADQDEISKSVQRQATAAIDAAQLVLLVMDIRDGVTPLDRTVALRLRKKGKTVIAVLNKADTPALEANRSDFAQLGFEHVVVVSALQRRGLYDLITLVMEMIGPATPEEVRPPEEPLMKLAIVGRRSVGKSTLVNALAGDERVIVSSQVGTTRDSVDVTIDFEGRQFVLIDTAGIRKRARMSESVEVFSRMRAERSIRRADVVMLMLNAADNIGDVEKKTASLVFSEYKPVVIVVNKIDLVKGGDRAKFAKYLLSVLPQLRQAPMVYISALKVRDIGKPVEIAFDLFEEAGQRPPTSEINRAVQAIKNSASPQVKHGMTLPKVYYATQVGVRPPTISLFVNEPDLFDDVYLRFFVNRLREHLPFKSVPIRLRLKKSGDSKLRK